jgi:hypothetical protein
MVEITKVPTGPPRKRTAKKTSSSALAICPADGAGWCPYPFSIAQLERHLKKKAECLEETTKGRQLVKAKSK